jgi:predicted phosphodiesterase
MSKKPAQDKVETVILRFRDLATSPGGTIQSHQDEISAHKYVWWGWWNKAGEKVPTETFTKLNQAAAGSGLKLMLFDSGSGRVYNALCTKIHWDQTLSHSESPERDATPQYYRDTKYFAWFKFSSMSEAPAEELHNWTYVQVNEFFETLESRFSPFYRKRVHSTDELRQQDRTIWFVRKFHESDQSHEIKLLDAFTFAPTDFPNEFRVSSNRNVLWLSDLHFSIDDHHGFPSTTTVAEHALWNVVESTLKEHNLDQLGAVILSGDFTWKADPKEFEQAKEFISELSSKLTVANYDYIICPGNHDVPFSDQPWNDHQKVTRPRKEAIKLYSSFYRHLFYREPNPYLACGRRVIFGRSVPVEFASLNSQMLDQKENVFQGHGFVGKDQLDFVRDQMAWKAPQDAGMPVRVVILHHHLLPVTFRDIPKGGANYSVSLDAEAIIRWIVENKIKIVLHGHQHQPYCTKITRSLKPGSADEPEFWVLGMGSSGVAQKDLGEIGKNTLGVLTFTAGSAEYKVFTIHKTNPSELVWSVTIPLLSE